ncbi:MAG: HEAT repeat protein [Verrucomicrobiales bacterium]|jgi:HEAT repeat protein
MYRLRTMSYSLQIALFFALWAPSLSQAQLTVNIADVAEATRLLGDAQPNVRASAAAWLYYHDGDVKPALNFLIETLDDKTNAIIEDPKTGETIPATAGKFARKCLIRIGEPAVNPLSVALLKQRPSVRWWAAHILGEIGSVEAVDFLVSALEQDSDKLVRMAASDALVKVGGKSIPQLVSLLDSESLDGRKNAIWILSEIGDERTIDSLLDIAMNDKTVNASRAIEALLKMGAEIVEPVLKIVDDPEVDVEKKNRAILITARLEHPLALQALLYTLLTHEDDQVRYNCLRALASHVDKPEITDAIINVLFDIDPKFRGSVPSLMKGMSPASGRIIARYMENPSEQLQNFSLISLTQLGDAASTPILAEIVRNESIEYKARQKAATILEARNFKNIEYSDKLQCFVLLGNWRLLSALGPEYKRFFIGLLGHTEGSVRAGGLNMLSSINDPEFVNFYFELMRDKDPGVREAARFAMLRLDRNAFPELSALLDVEISPRVLTISQVLDQKLYRPKTDIEKASFYANNNFWTQMEFLGEGGLAYLLEVLLDNKDLKKRCWAAWTLARFYDNVDLDTLSLRDLDRTLYLLLYLEDRRLSNTTYITLGAEADKAAISYLLVSLLSGKESLNALAAKSLGRAGRVSPEALYAMDICLKSQMPEIQQKALMALEEMCEAAFPLLVRYMQDEHVGTQIIDLLSKLNYSPEATAEKIDYYLATGEFNELARMGRAGMLPLVAAASNEDFPNRVDAIRSLGSAPDDTVVEPLIHLMLSADQSIRTAAREAITQLGETAIPQLRRYSRGHGILLTRAAAIGLGLVNYEPETVNDKVWYAAAANDWDKLLEMGDVAKQELKRSLISQDDYTRAIATGALSASREYMISSARREQARFPKNIEAALTSKSAEVRGMGAFLVAMHGEEAVHLIPRLVSMLGDDSIIQWSDLQLVEIERMKTPGAQAAIALARMGEAAIPAVTEAVKVSSPVAKQNAMLALAAIADPRLTQEHIKALKNPQRYIRGLAAMSLGTTRAVEGAVPLLDTARDDNSQVRHAATKAIVQIGERAILPLIEEMNQTADMDRKELILRMLGEIGSDSATIDLGRMLKSKDIKLRRAALRSLGKVKSKTAIDLLILGLEDEYWTLRESAASLLATIGFPAINQLIAAIPEQENGTGRYIQRVLEEITGESFGQDAAAWSRWWKVHSATLTAG